MYKLMVVDDEQIVIDAVKHIVKSEMTKLKVSQTVRSGRGAIEKAQLERPDIVLMDIRMPGINGLEAIREIQKNHNNIKFIIVTAYEYFEFAKQAVELGVTDYLLKPVNKQRLIEVLEKTILLLDEERKKYDFTLETRERIEKMLSIVGHGFIYSLLLSQKADIGKYKELFKINSNKGYIFILTFKGKNDGGSVVKLGEGMHNQRLYSFFIDHLHHRSKCIIGPMMLDRIVVYAAASDANAYKQRVAAIAMLEEILERAEDKFNVDLRIGIGGLYDDEGILVSYQEALRALNYSDSENITHIDDIPTDLGSAGYEMLSEEKTLVEAIEKGNASQCANMLQDIFNKYAQAYENESLKNRFVEIMVAAHRVAIEHGIKDDESVDSGKYIMQITGCKSQSEFEHMYIEKITQIAAKIRDNKKNNIGIVVDCANQIIKERFDKELTLDGISKELCISPQYFSRLYKDKMGINFIEKLTTVRIEHAKTLMKQGEHTIKEICYMSGYSDPNYFSRLFKKYEGVSPTIYSKQLNGGLS